MSLVYGRAATDRLYAALSEGIASQYRHMQGYDTGLTYILRDLLERSMTGQGYSSINALVEASEGLPRKPRQPPMDLNLSTPYALFGLDGISLGRHPGSLQRVCQSS